MVLVPHPLPQRSALDAVELMNIGVQFLREHIEHAVHHFGRRKHFIVAEIRKATQDIGIMLVYHLAIVSCNQRCIVSKILLRHLA